MQDTTIKIGSSQIQHGNENDRIYLMHLEKCDMPGILEKLDELAENNNYSKIFAKIPGSLSCEFSNRSYVEEAMVPGFFDGKEDCFFMAKYLSPARKLQVDEALNNKVLDVANSKNVEMPSKVEKADYIIPEGFSFRQAEYSDAAEMASLYSRVFESYPFPVFDPDFIKQTMADNLVYFGIWKDGDIVALSSCEMSKKDKNVEMTDFAVLPEYRGHGFALFLLEKMEREMKKRDIKTAYTIARAVSYGMNSTFSKSGYSFAGRLVQNTHICGKIEDMNVWYKTL